MAEFWHNFHFLRPWLLLLLLLPLGAYGLYFRGVNGQSSWQNIIDARLLAYLQIKGSAAKRRILVWVGLIGTVSAIIAASGPSWQKIEVPSFVVQNPIILALNLSSDMQATDLTPSRLDRAKYKIKDFLEALPGAQVGLEVYSDEPYVIAPITDDVNILTNLLPAIGADIMPSNGDRLDRAIAMAVDKIKATGYTSGRIVFFTADVGQKFDLALAAAKQAAADGFVIHVIGTTAEPNEKLALIAQSGGGNYYNLGRDEAQIEALAASLAPQDKGLSKSDNLRTIWLDAGWYMVWLPLISCLFFFRKGILVAVLVLISSEASAGFFLNADQEALQAFNRGDYDAASLGFRAAPWQAAAYYRRGDYQKAYEIYQQDNSSEGLYNQGNALAKGGKIDEAIVKYEEVLAQNPDHEDAKFNLEYLKQQKQQQQKQQPDEDNNQNQDNQNQQNQDQEPDNQSNGENRPDEGQNSEGNQDSEQNRQDNPANPQQDGKQDINSNSEDNRADEDRSSSIDELDKTDTRPAGKEQSGALPQDGDENEQYDEETQAKARRYREIPEDPGGLLKAFIYQEYRQNRYKENRE